MKVIQTLYRDHLFRSRLEARYAVFFDALSQKWEYEREGYDLDGDYYLPDFYLPALKCFVEIKGKEPNASEIRKCRKLQYFTESNVVICSGLPMERDGILFSWSDDLGGSFTETVAQWAMDDGELALSDEPQYEDWALADAASLAKQARFEFGQHPELAASRILPNSVDYDAIRF